jgi:hypothetical protein
MKDLSMHIMDIVQNSITAMATEIRIDICESKKTDTYAITITDNGKGMSKETIQKVTDPFFTTRTTRKVGLGIPLLKMNCERCGGKFKIDSELMKGTKLTAELGLTNIDRPASGDIPGTVALLVSSNPAIDFIYSHSTGNGSYVFNTKEVKEILEGIPINEPSVYPLIKEMITENLIEIKAS